MAFYKFGFGEFLCRIELNKRIDRRQEINKLIKITKSQITIPSGGCHFDRQRVHFLEV